MSRSGQRIRFTYIVFVNTRMEKLYELSNGEFYIREFDGELVQVTEEEAEELFKNKN